MNGFTHHLVSVTTALALLAVLLPAAARAQTQAAGNKPHGYTSGSTTSCDVAHCQASELPIVQYELLQLVNKIPTGTTCNAGQDTRDLTNAALANMLLNNYSAASMTQAVQWVTCAFSGVDPTTHEVLQCIGCSINGNDPNYTEFTMIGLAAMIQTGRPSYLRMSKLSAATIGNIESAMIGLANHINNSNSGSQLDQTTTNMYLMNTAARMLAAKALDDQNVGVDYTADFKQSENQLYAYLYYIQNWGIHEFDSTTYSSTQMYALLEGYTWASVAGDKQNFKAALDYLWTDLAANFFEPGIRMVPPYSRNYSFTNGQGSTQAYAEVLGGWMTETSNGDAFNDPNFAVTSGGSGILTNGALPLEGAELLDAMTATSPYTSPAASYALATTTGTAANRLIYQLWGQPTHDHNTADLPLRAVAMYNNLTAGCTSGYYGTQDKLFGISLAGSISDAGANRNLTLIGNTLDSTGAPYGYNNVIGNDGSSKPNHVAENPVCAFYAGATQTAALVSTYFDANVRSDNNGNQGLWSDVLFPVDTANLNDAKYPVLYLNGTAFSCTPQSDSTCIAPLSLSNGDTVTWRRSNGTAAATGIAGVRVMEITPAPITPSGTYAAKNATGYQLELDLCGSVFNPMDGNGKCKANYSGRIVMTHANTSAPVNGSGTAPQSVTYLFMTDDTATSPSALNGVLHGAVFSNFSGGSDSHGPRQGYNVNFASSNYPGGIVNSLALSRSEALFTDIGYAVVNVAQGSSGQPGHSAALTAFTPQNDYSNPAPTTTLSSATFWTNNPVYDPNGFTCSTPLCSAANP